MPALLPDVDPEGLLEFSVVYTDRSLNHMSQDFQSVMRDLNSTLCSVYNAQAAVIVPGSGTFAMEAVARQFAGEKHTLIVRNGWFSYRWTQILEAGHIASGSTVLRAKQPTPGHQQPFAPVPVEEVIEAINNEHPQVVFAPHVETSSGMILPDEYIKAIAKATHDDGGLFVLDCIASGTCWVDMEALGVDVLISAPQKGWSGPPCAGIAMLSERAVTALDQTESSSFSCDLKKWHQIMQAYLDGGHAYHATMPTDALRKFRDVAAETVARGTDKVKAQQIELGQKIRAVLSEAGYRSVAAEGFEAPGVVVVYTDDVGLHNGKKFAAAGVQIAAGVPLRCNEPADYQTFRIGLFGLDKLADVDATVARFKTALSESTS